MSALPVPLEVAEIQRPILYGYGMECSRHFVLRVRHVYTARRFIGELACRRLIANAAIDGTDVQEMDRQGYAPVNIGISFQGLEELGLPQRYLYVFQEKAKAFAEGAYLRAARRLADTGPSAAERWQDCFKPDQAHILLSIYADDEAGLASATARLTGLDGADGLCGWDCSFDAAHLTTKQEGRTVHFGYRDGISVPAIEGTPGQKNTKDLHEPGEFLLGYDNDAGFNPWRLPFPHLLPWLLPPQPEDCPEFFRNGSFAVFRKIEQDVKGFHDAVTRWAKQLEGGRNPGKQLEDWSEYVMAKLCGRSRDGRAASAASPSDSGWNTKPEDKDLNDFDFSDDKDGLGCPFGAHIRRMNPRAGPAVVPLRRRPLIRRGMPYGPKFDPSAAPTDPKPERGLLGLFFCASLEHQFEHLLGQWGDANPMGPYNRGNAKDPLIGNHQDPRSVFDIPLEGEDLRQLEGFTPYVTTRGTLYAFYPSLKALSVIGRARDWR